MRQHWDEREGDRTEAIQAFLEGRQYTPAMTCQDVVVGIVATILALPNAWFWIAPLL